MFAPFRALAKVVALKAVLLISNPLEVDLVMVIRHENRGADNALARSDLNDNVVVTEHHVPLGTESGRVEMLGDSEDASAFVESRERTGGERPVI